MSDFGFGRRTPAASEQLRRPVPRADHRGAPRPGPASRTLVAACLAALVVSACSSRPDQAVTPSLEPSPAVVTGPAATVPPPPATVTGLRPGLVRLGDGPFNDRFQLDDLAFHAAERPSVSAAMRVTSDVSELLLLEARVGFYDRAGGLVGQGRFTYQPTEHAGNTPEDGPTLITVTAEDRAATAVAAVLTIPHLVNE